MTTKPNKNGGSVREFVCFYNFNETHAADSSMFESREGFQRWIDATTRMFPKATRYDLVEASSVEELVSAVSNLQTRFTEFSSRQNEVFSRDHTKKEFDEVTSHGVLDFDEMFQALAKFKQKNEGGE